MPGVSPAPPTDDHSFSQEQLPFDSMSGMGLCCAPVPEVLLLLCSLFSLDRFHYFVHHLAVSVSFHHRLFWGRRSKMRVA